MKPRNLSHIRLFGCHVLYRPLAAKLETFKERPKDGLCLYRESSGIYLVLDDNRIIRAKHVQVKEHSFLGVNLFKESSKRRHGGKNKDDASVEITADTENMSPEAQQGEMTQPQEEENTTPLNLDAIVYTPIEPSSFGVTDKEDNFEDVLEVEGDASENTVQGNDGPYNLRSVPRVQYSNAAVTTIVDETDEPTLLKALIGPDRKKGLEAICTELNGIVSKRTWKETQMLPSETKSLPSVFILKIKRDEKCEVINHKTRIVMRGNLQTDVVEPAELYASVAEIKLVWIILSIAILNK